MFEGMDVVGCSNLRCQALQIIEAGLLSVVPKQLFLDKVSFEGNNLIVGDESVEVPGRIFVVGAGKASGLMAQSLEERVPIDRIAKGIVNCTSSGYPTQKIKVNKASHPIPDEAGIAGVKEMLALRDEMQEGDVVVCLLSGGGSALLPQPAGNITLEDEKWLTEQFFAFGIPTSDVNVVRKHISYAKGGKLARHFSPFKVISIIISNIPTGDLSLVASGPTIDPTTKAMNAYEILHKYKVDIPDSVEEYLKHQMSNEDEIPPLENVHNCLIGDVKTAIEEMSDKCQELGYKPFVIADDVQGDTEEEAKHRADEIVTDSYIGFNALLLGGQTVQQLPDDHGKNSRVCHFALTSLKQLQQLQREWVMVALKSDGLDENNIAGIIIDNTTPTVDIDRFLREYDSYTYFESIGNCVLKTGNLATNVCDLVLYLVK